MLKLILIIAFSLTNASAQIDDIELESLDDISILDEFNSGNIDKKNQSIEVINDSPSFIDIDEDIADDDLGNPTENDEEDQEMVLDDSVNEVDLESLELRNITPLNEVELTTNTMDDEKNNSKLSLEQDRKALEELKIVKIKDIEDIIANTKKDSKRRFTDFELTALKVQLTDITKSPIRTVHIVRGTKLIRIEDNKAVYTPKTLTVKAHVLLDFYKNRYIINNKGQLKYKVYYKNTSNISRVTKMHRSPRKFTRLPKKITRSLYDKKFKYSHNLSLHAGLNAPNYTDSLLEDPSAIAPLLRIESTFLTNQAFLFDSGFTFMYESIVGVFKSNGQYSISSFSLGPSFKSKPLIGGFGVTIQPRISLLSRVSYLKENISNSTDLSESTLLVGLEKESHYKPYGKFLFGMNFQRKWVRIDSKEINLSVGSHVNHDDSFALYVGHRSDWIW